MKKCFYFLLMGVIVLTLNACSEEEKQEQQAEKKLEQIEEEVGKGLDRELTLDLLKSDQVEKAYVQDKGQTTELVIYLKEGVSAEEKEQLKDSYHEKLKEKYPGQNITITIKR